MTYDEVLKSARGNMGPYCKVCSVCNGAACKNQMPGPGAKGVGDNAVRNYQKWQEIRVNMDTIHRISRSILLLSSLDGHSSIRFLQVR